MLLALLFACNTSPLDTAEGLPAREQVGPITVLRISGTPYEMGLAHGQLLRDEIAEGTAFIDGDPIMSGLMALAGIQGLFGVAADISDGDMLSECEGLVDGAAGSGWTMDHCLLLNTGDVLTEMIAYPPGEDGEGASPGCSQVVASGAATVDGDLVHGRLMDWERIDFILDHPVLFVRSPVDEAGTAGIPHVVVGFPGNLSPYQGMNMEGIVLATNEATPANAPASLPDGLSHVQLQGALLGTASSVDDVRAAVTGAPHMSTEIQVVSDGDARSASIFEMAVAEDEERPMVGDVIYVSNHFVAETTTPLHATPSESSAKRFARLGQLIDIDGVNSLHGSIDASVMRDILRDRVDAWTGEQFGTDVTEDAPAIATNGALFGVVFEPSKRHLHVAAGGVPVPLQDWHSFSLHALLGLDDPNPLTHEVLP